MGSELERLQAACERLEEDRLQEVLDLLADAEEPLGTAEQGLVAAAQGLIAERRGDLEEAIRCFEGVHALGVPLEQLLRASARFFRRHGRAEANESFAMLADIDPAATEEFLGGLTAAERTRFAPAVVRRYLFGTPPQPYALAPVKRALGERLGRDAAALAFAQMARLEPGWDVRRLPIVGLREFARTRGREYRQIAPAQSVRVPPAPVFGAADADGDEARTRTLFSCVISDAIVSSKSTFVLVDDEAILDYQGEELDKVPIDLDVEPNLFAREGNEASFLIAAGAHVREPLPRALTLVGVNSHAFGHLLVEFLPKLLVLLDAPEFDSVPILVDEQMPHQHREAIEFFAGPTHELVTLPAGAAIRVEELWTCSMITNISLAPVAGSGDHVPLLALDPDVFRALIEKVQPKLDEIEPAQPKRIYLARKDTQLRRLVNRGRVQEWFAAQGFEVVDLERLSFAEQLALVRGAEVIVGPDGSSMQMSFFAGPDTRIGILDNPYLEDHRFYRMACEALGQRLLVLTGGVVQEHPGYKKFSDYRIEEAALPLFLDTLTAEPDRSSRAVNATGVADEPDARPKVSVLLQTYNHERYIARAIESVLEQEAPFPIELIVSDDLSGDATREVVSRYVERHPELVKPLLPDEHLGMNPLFRRALDAARGEYVALLDGDDYWTSPDKLRRQVEVLESQPELTGCFHDAVAVYEDGDRPPHPYVPGERKARYEVEDLIRLCYPPTLSVLFRRELLADAPDWVFELAWADWALWILATARGPFAYVDEAMGVYRVHPGGYFSSRDRSSQLEEDIAMYLQLREHLPDQRALVERCLTRRECELAVEECRLPYDRPIVMLAERDDLPLQFNGRSVSYLEGSADKAGNDGERILDRIRQLCAEAGHRPRTPAARPRLTPQASGGACRCYVVVPRAPGEDAADYAAAIPDLSKASGRLLWEGDRGAIYEFRTADRAAAGSTPEGGLHLVAPAVIESISKRDPPDPRARGRIETPAAGDLVDLATTPIAGWALGHEVPVTHVELRRGEDALWECPVQVERSDVALVFPGQEWARNAGFRGSADLHGALGSAAEFELAVTAVLSDGTRVNVASINGRGGRAQPDAVNRSTSRPRTRSESR